MSKNINAVLLDIYERLDRVNLEGSYYAVIWAVTGVEIAKEIVEEVRIELVVETIVKGDKT
jgi:hypothetical protein